MKAAARDVSHLTQGYFALRLEGTSPTTATYNNGWIMFSPMPIREVATMDRTTKSVIIVTLIEPSGAHWPCNGDPMA